MNSTKQVNDAIALISTMESRIRDAFLLAFQNASRSVDLKEFARLLEKGDLWGAAEMFRFDQSIMYPLEESIRSTYVAAGSLVSQPIGTLGVFTFSGRHPRAELWTSSIGSTKIQGILDDTLEMAREVITEGMQDGFSPIKVGRSLTGTLNPINGKREGGFLGLTVQQRQSIKNGMENLSSGDPARMVKYLDLELRNKSFDKMIKRAIAKGLKIPQSTLNKIRVAHNNKALKYRGQVIAKNEAFTAQSEGRDEAFRQVLERPDVDDVTARWQHNLSQKPRPEHVEMGSKPPISLKLGQRFEFSDASMRCPHDPAGGPKHSIGCRCIAVYRIILERD